TVFTTKLRRRKLSVTNITRLDFIFLMSDRQNANRSPFFSAGLPNWHSAGTATRSRGSATQTLERPNMKPCRSTLNGAPRARVLRLRTLLNDAALFQVAQDATDILARQPSGDGLYAYAFFLTPDVLTITKWWIYGAAW